MTVIGYKITKFGEKRQAPPPPRLGQAILFGVGQKLSIADFRRSKNTPELDLIIIVNPRFRDLFESRLLHFTGINWRIQLLRKMALALCVCEKICFLKLKYISVRTEFQSQIE